MITIDDRIKFLSLVKAYAEKYTICVEIGVFQGEFSQLIINILKPSKLYLIDPFEKNNIAYPEMDLVTAYSTEDNYQDVINRFHMRLLNMQMVIYRNYSYEAVGRFVNESIHFVYHDGSHLYVDLKRDLNEWIPKLTASGLMCGHDYANELFPGVKQAVDEFCLEHNFEMIIYNENGGDYALKRK